MRGYHATEAYKKAMRKRQVWVEPLFAEAKVWHGLRRFRLTGLENVNIEGLLIAAGQNLKRLLVGEGGGGDRSPAEPLGSSCPTFPSPASALVMTDAASYVPRPDDSTGRLSVLPSTA